MTTLTKFTAESLTTDDQPYTFDLWAVDFDDAWAAADKFAAANRLGKVDEVRVSGQQEARRPF